MRSDQRVSWSEEEILDACRHWGLGRPPTLPGPPISAVPDPPPGPPAVTVLSDPPGWLRDLVGTLAEPEVVCFARRQRAGSAMELRVYAGSPPCAVEQFPTGRLQQLSLFDFADMVSAMVAFCELDLAGPTIAGSSLAISFRTFMKVLERAAVDTSGLLPLLRMDGLRLTEAEAFLRTLRSARSLAEITVAHRPSDVRLEGSTTGWLDGGAGGLWRVDAPKMGRSSDYGAYGQALLDQTSVTLTPVGPLALVEEIRSGFPAPYRARLAQDG